MISDSFDLKLVDGAVYEVDCARITIGNDNIGTPASFLTTALPQALTRPFADIGANPSAEDGGDEGTDDTASTAIDVVHSFRLQPTFFDKKTYMAFLKQYIKKVKEHMKSRDASEDEIKEFETGVKSYVSSDTFKKFKYDFYTGESMDTDGMVVLLNYRADDTPYCVFCKRRREKGERKRVLTYHREARYVRDEGLESLRNRQAGCISAGLSSINDALSYDIHEPTQARSTPLQNPTFLQLLRPTV